MSKKTSIEEGVRSEYYHSQTGQLIHSEGKSSNPNKIRVFHRVPSRMMTQQTSSVGTFKSEIIPNEDTFIGLKSAIPDKTQAFNKQLKETETFFSNAKSRFSSFEIRDKFMFFKDQVTDGAPYDIKLANGGDFTIYNPFNYYNEYAFYNDMLFRFDDFGNYNYGVAGKALGISGIVLQAGAGGNQFSKFPESPMGGITSFLDDDDDNYMIREGIKHYENNQNEDDK